MPVSGVVTRASPSPSVALVNNMPDGAFLDTEAQFRRAIQAQEDDEPLELQLYTLPGLVRTEVLEAEIRARYRPIDELWAAPPDALIVTGTEPSQTSLQYEPYWPQLANLLQWAADTVPVTMLSCLASHASVLLFDGIERVALERKRHGIFPCAVSDPDDPLARDLPATPLMPHSRINDVPIAALRDAGYTILATDGADSWSVACRRQVASMFVLCQGHPEYSPESLLREYRRDVRRALLGRGMVPYPAIPEGYLDAAAVRTLQTFAVRATRPGVDPADMWESLPVDDIAARVTYSWAPTAAALYRNWLSLAQVSAASRRES